MLNRLSIATYLTRAADLLEEGTDPRLIALALRNLSKDVRDPRRVARLDSQHGSR